MTPIPEHSEPQRITELLARAATGDDLASETLMPLLYDKLRELAGAYFRHQTPAQTLQPTALVHEAWLKLTRGREIEWESRAHFYAVSALAMRQILMNHAAQRRAARRGGGRAKVTLSGLADTPDVERQVDLIDLDDALAKLAELSPEQARIVELRFLAGVSENEIAVLMGVSERTVRRQWRMARAFLRGELSGEGIS